MNQSKRIPIGVYHGQHKALIDTAEWTEMQVNNQQRIKNPGNFCRHRSIYELKGLVKCWECWNYFGQIVGMRFGTGGRGARQICRCGALHDYGARRRSEARQSILLAADAVGINLLDSCDLEKWKHAHSTILAEKMATQVDIYVSRLSIPSEWHHQIQAYYVHPDGLAHFERGVAQLDKRQYAVQQAYEKGQITHAEVVIQNTAIENQKAVFWTRNLVQPAQQVMPLVQDFSLLWKKLGPSEKNSLLRIMFAGLFFDGKGILRWILAHSPFDRWMGMPEGGMIIERE